MLSTFLSQLQQTFSKYFLLGSFFPIFSFMAINAIIATIVIPDFYAQMNTYLLRLSIFDGATVATAVLIVITLVAYVLYGLSTALRQVLEGRYWGAFGALLVPAESQRRENLRRKLDKVGMEIADFGDEPMWKTKMAEARETGKKDFPKHMREPNDKLVHNLDTLEGEMRKFHNIEAAKLEDIVESIVEQLRLCDIDKSQALLEQQQRLGRLLKYAGERAPALYVQLQNEINANFGAQSVAPTSMGNVANSIQSYALRRYKCNLESVWSNLLRIAQNDDKTQTMFLEAKTQLDFLVACCWLNILTTALWALIFAFILPSCAAFLIVSLGGPVTTWFWYRAATEQYRSFASVAMTTLDTLRFKLLQAMRIHAPADVAEERAIWEHIDILTTLGEEINFRYEFPGS